MNKLSCNELTKRKEMVIFENWGSYRVLGTALCTAQYLLFLEPPNQ